jgi:hypothetical protein
MHLFSSLATIAAAQLGTVQIEKQAAAEISDVTLGEVLADQLRLAPKISTPAEAETVTKWSSSMFEKPASVFLAIVDGVQESGVKLESACAPVKECVAGTCYGTSAACVAHNLMSQSESHLSADLQAKFHDATVVGVSSEASRGSAAGHAGAHVLFANVDTQMAVTLVGDHERTETASLANVGEAVEPLRSLAKMERDGSKMTVSLSSVSATLDTKNPCTQLLFGEAIAMVEAAPSTLSVYAPRSVACMRAKYGDNAEESKVATALITAALKSAQEKQKSKFGKTFSAVVHLPPVDASAQLGAASALAPVLLESQRRLQTVTSLAVGGTTPGTANFHIYTWTTLAMVGALIGAVYSIVAMTSDRDPLLYAKFRPEVDMGGRR